MKFVGPHVSAAGGVSNAPLNAAALGATAFALFTKNQRQWKAKDLTLVEIDLFKKNMIESGFTPDHVLPHDSYLINLGNPDRDKRKVSVTSFIHELTRCSQLGLLFLNTHPGAHLNGATEEECCALISDSINRALEKTSGVTVVIENTAGQGSWVGYRFEHLAEIIEKVDDKSRIGICIDTCHAHAAGYDIRDARHYEHTMNELDSIVGRGYLKGMHCNDAKSEFGSRVDRHQNLGKGTLGLEPFRLIMNDPRLDNIPLILETIDETLWDKEVKMMYSFAGK
jgi:deoxyribonuclease-4